jgi:hypothetical protein
MAGALSGTAVGPKTGGNLLLHETRRGLSAAAFLIDSITLLIDPFYPVDGDGPSPETNCPLPVCCQSMRLFYCLIVSPMLIQILL